MVEMVGIRPIQYRSLNGGKPQEIDGAIVEEAQVCLSVNGLEIANFMCSPNDLDLMAYGFLYNRALSMPSAMSPAYTFPTIIVSKYGSTMTSPHLSDSL